MVFIVTSSISYTAFLADDTQHGIFLILAAMAVGGGVFALVSLSKVSGGWKFLPILSLLINLGMVAMWWASWRFSYLSF